MSKTSSKRKSVAQASSSPRWKEALPFLAVILVAVIVRTVGLDWGLPEIYEEATPHKKAWDLWGWNPADSFSLNPEFFNYPSLTIYIQFAVQAVVSGLLMLFGQARDGLDLQVQHAFHPTPFYLAGRLVGVAFALGTVALTYRMGRELAGRTAGIVAAMLLALNLFHVRRSQEIEVDVPLTFFVLWAFWTVLRILRDPTPRHYVMAGLAVGLAASTKYTGALLVLPLLAAHVLAAHPRGARSWRTPLTALGVAAVAFVLTSPYVLLDFQTFWADLGRERVHVRVGHFGLEEGRSYAFYLGALSTRLLGWPLFLLTLGGLAVFAFQRRRWAWILGGFALVYLAIVGSWSMRADRYLLPTLPLFMLLGSAFLVRVRDATGLRGLPGMALVAALALAALAPQAWSAGPYLDRMRTDTRTEAKQWIESNLAPGSFLVSELNGPRLFGPARYWPLDPQLKERIRDHVVFYALLDIPSFQVGPEYTAPFYDFDLYPMADFLITVSFIRDRYEANPGRYPQHNRFYEELESRFEVAREFPSRAGTSPTITIYRNPEHTVPFARRGRVRGPGPLKHDPRRISGEEAFFLYSFGLNYETFEYYRAALVCYAEGLRLPSGRETVRHNLILGSFRTLRADGQEEQALGFMRRALEEATEPRYRDQYARILQRYGRPGG